MFGRKDKNIPEPRRIGTVPGRQNVFSYYANRSAPESAVGRGDTRREGSGSWFRGLRNLPTVLSVIVMVLAGLYACTLSTSPRVAINNDSPQQLARPSQEYQQAATRFAKQSIFNHTKLTVDTGSIEARMRQEFPEIEVVEVTVPMLGRKPVVELSTITPVFSLINNTGEYFIASDGRATALVAAYELRPPHAVKLYDQSGLSLKPGEQILTKATVSFINQVIMQMQTKQVRIASLTLPTTPYELQMRLEGASYYVRFNTLGDARLQSGAFLALKDELARQKQQPAEYIDVRVEDRAFYK